MSVFSPKINPLDPNKSDHWSLEDIVATYGGKGLIFCRPALSKKTFVKVKLDLANLPVPTLEKLIEKTSALPISNLDQTQAEPVYNFQPKAAAAAPEKTSDLFGPTRYEPTRYEPTRYEPTRYEPTANGPTSKYTPLPAKPSTPESEYMSASSANSFESVPSSSINSPATNVNANANPITNANTNANFNVNANQAAYAGPGNMNMGMRMGPTNLALLGGKGEDLTRIFNALKEVEVRSDERVFLVDDKPPLAKALPQEGGRRTKRSSTKQRKVTQRQRTVGRARARARVCTHKRRM